MGEVLPLTNPGEVFDDVRDNGRTMRVSHHAEAGMVIVSLWAGGLCRASFRLRTEDVPRLMTVLGEVDLTAPAPEAPEVGELRAS
jgi:hypothetical protein